MEKQLAGLHLVAPDFYHRTYRQHREQVQE
jgi:hypothetical protein